MQDWSTTMTLLPDGSRESSCSRSRKPLLAVIRTRPRFSAISAKAVRSALSSRPYGSSTQNTGTWTDSESILLFAHSDGVIIQISRLLCHSTIKRVPDVKSTHRQLKQQIPSQRISTPEERASAGIMPDKAPAIRIHRGRSAERARRVPLGRPASIPKRKIWTEEDKQILAWQNPVHGAGETDWPSGCVRPGIARSQGIGYEIPAHRPGRQNRAPSWESVKTESIPCPFSVTRPQRTMREVLRS